MEFRVKAIINGVAPTLISLLLASTAAAQDPKLKSNYLKNIELCNSSDRTTVEPRINGCTALIDSGRWTWRGTSRRRRR